jgi:CheY-like chemotaxis protein
MISVESVLGKGCTFHLYFPVLARGAVRGAASQFPADPEEMTPTCQSGRPARILFVDDEYAVTRLASSILGKYGICVETENDSLKALETFRERMVEFDLLVTAQTMPGLTGVELTREVLRMRPDFPVILCTGYSATVSPEQAKAAGIREYVHKPVDFKKVALTIERLTAGRQLPVNGL